MAINKEITKHNIYYKYIESLAAERKILVGFCACSVLFQSSQCDLNGLHVYFLTFYKVKYQNSECFQKICGSLIDAKLFIRGFIDLYWS